MHKPRAGAQLSGMTPGRDGEGHCDLRAIMPPASWHAAPSHCHRNISDSDISHYKTLRPLSHERRIANTDLPHLRVLALLR
jgi:hypothetical protein